MQNYYQLNAARVLGAIEAQDLKHYWVAEQAGVHKTTLRRWLKGRIEKVSTKRITRLAEVLQRDWRQLVLNSACQNGASPDTVYSHNVIAKN